MHVVLGVPGPRAAPAPADRPKRLDDPTGHHPWAMVGAVAVRLRRGISALTAADVGVLDRVEVDCEPIGVHGPRASATTAGARRRDRLAALERGADVAVAGAAASRTVEVAEGHVADRKMQAVELPEHAGERMRRVLVDDELPSVY